MRKAATKRLIGFMKNMEIKMPIGAKKYNGFRLTIEGVTKFINGAISNTSRPIGLEGAACVGAPKRCVNNAHASLRLPRSSAVLPLNHLDKNLL
ncbi:hypothetical protein ACFL3J_02730 [Candidatus Omnitrophota bacterium]